MSEPLLNVMKVMLLCGLYLFFLRVLWSVFSELRDPRTVARKRNKAVRGAKATRGATAAAGRSTVGAAVPTPVAQPAAAFASASAAPAAPPVGATPTPAGPMGQLRVVDPQEFAGHVYALGTQVTVGRAQTNSIVLDDTYVSTVHARLFQTNGGTYFVEDLASRNGSTINGKQILATTALAPGDLLQIGATTMEFA